MLKVKRPVDAKYKISSPFGPRDLMGRDFHNGIDFAVPVGTEVRSFADGFVYKAGYEDSKNPKFGLGLRVWIKFKDGDVTYDGWVGHLSEVFVQPGDLVKVGTVIGKSGNTGRSTGPHLHIQFRHDKTGKFVNVEFS